MKKRGRQISPTPAKTALLLYSCNYDQLFNTRCENTIQY